MPDKDLRERGPLRTNIVWPRRQTQVDHRKRVLVPLLILGWRSLGLRNLMCTKPVREPHNQFGFEVGPRYVVSLARVDKPETVHACPLPFASPEKNAWGDGKGHPLL